MTEDQNFKEASDEMSEYVQMFLDETEEQLDDLVETLLVLEQQPENKEELNEAFRLIHSIKGSAGMMGYNSIISLTHHLENHFERLRSGLDELDQSTMNLVLRCIDFLRASNEEIRAGGNPGTAPDLLDELHELDNREASGDYQSSVEEHEAHGESSSKESDNPPADGLHVVIVFEEGLQLADLKAQLIVSRLSSFGEIKSVSPALDQMEDIPDLTEFELVIDTDHPADEISVEAKVDGVLSIELHEPSPNIKPQIVDEVEEPLLSEDPNSQVTQDEATQVDEPEELELTEETLEQKKQSESLRRIEGTVPEESEQPQAIQTSSIPSASKTEPTKARSGETLRIEIDRLDKLMNLAGELVINRAQFVQFSNQLNPIMRKRHLTHRIRDFSDTLRQTIEELQQISDKNGDWNTRIQELQSGLELMNEQAQGWENSRRHFSQIFGAVDQLTRVSDSLQRSVLETRMVPIGPLFNRFKRVVRDLSVSSGKEVELVIHGEKTEIDKRMIDEIGDPLIHLIRNSVDHGIELPEERINKGKKKAGVIRLDASHRGNNVYISIQDDGNGINLDKIKNKLLTNCLVSESLINELSDQEIIDYIWHPGFSTATKVTDVSGRGVGMDVVKSRISELNGSIEIDSGVNQGTKFTIRLPLTLAIINSLLVRMRDVIFSVPIHDVHEIVAVKPDDIVCIQGRETVEVRGEFLPLVDINTMFSWSNSSTFTSNANSSEQQNEEVNVLILQTNTKRMGLRVGELLGSQDIVIKSLSENFTSIAGLSGASILGDGSVCLMLDVATAIEMATEVVRSRQTRREVASVRIK